MDDVPLRLGTRGSALAMVQTNMVADALRRAHPSLSVDTVTIETSGDWKPANGETRLCEAAGGKGLFAKEIEQALMTGRIDAGIHSLKDMPSFLPAGLALDHVFPREDSRDAFLSNRYETLDALPPGAIVGTSSLRRQAMILAKRPDLKIVPFRGNVPTRIEKLRAEQVDATLLAVAGLKRLDLTHEIAAILEPEDMLPAAGQGIVGIETRTDDSRTRNLFDPLHCSKTGLCAAAERAALQALDGSCHTPIGAHAVFADGRMHLHVMVAAPDGGNIWTAQETENVTNREEAAALGRKLGSLLEKQVPAEVLGR